MHLLVTGAAGFIGSHLCERLLREGHSVTGLDNFDPFYDPALKWGNVAELQTLGGHRFRLVEGDLRDGPSVAAALQGAEAVVHLAAMAGVRPSIEKPLLYEDVNVRGTLLLLEAMRAAGVRRLVFGSSSSVYGENVKVPFAEDDRVDHPISPYAATKKAGELVCHTWHHLYGLSVACLRFFTVYGPRQRPDLAIAKFTRLLLADQPVPFFGDGGASRDYTYVLDIVDGIMRALEWTDGMPRYDIFNLGNARPVDLATLVRLIEVAVGRTARLERLPRQPGDVARTFADVHKASEKLGFVAKTSIDEGIGRYVEWARRRSS
jgi:UDP-glucuronate 4-epimerase